MSRRGARRIIQRTADITEGVAHLCRCEPRFRAAAKVLPTPPLRRSVPGFETLLRSVVSQQLSVAAADSIWTKLTARRPPTAEALHRARVSSLAEAGLSRPKISYVKGLARMVVEGTLPLERLGRMDDEAAIELLTAARGVGRWTAEIYMMFGHGRADIIAAGDLALQEGAKELFELPARPSEEELRALAERWAPWRAVAARILWQYYRHVRQREGIVGGA